MTRIVLVDEHASSRESLAIALEQQPGMTVLAQTGTLNGGRMALATESRNIDLVIFDVHLPDGPGEDLIPALRDANPDAVCLVLTSAGEPEKLARAIKAGASAIVHKSASIEELLATIRQLHTGERLLSHAEVVTALQLVEQEQARHRKCGQLLEQLTERELDILHGLADGLSDRDIADLHHVSLATVRTHVTSILGKLNATSRLQALVTAVRHGIVSID
jgi:DNA-binding NarL/FixJ family response regulator